MTSWFSLFVFVCTCSLSVGGALWRRQWAAGQAAEHHGCHQFVHVHLWTGSLTAEAQQWGCGGLSVFSIKQLIIRRGGRSLTFWERWCRTICRRPEKMAAETRRKMEAYRRRPAEWAHLKPHPLRTEIITGQRAVIGWGSCPSVYSLSTKNIFLGLSPHFQAGV